MWLLRFMTRLPRMIVLVVLAFLVKAGAAHRKFRLASATLRGFCTAFALRTRNLLSNLPRIGNIGLPLEDAKLLLVRLLALQQHLSGAAIPIVSRRTAAPVTNLCLIDSALWI